MSKAPTKTQTPRKRALIMALYTLVLAFGAALPVAASYSDSIAERSSSGEEIRGGAGQREITTCAAGDEAEQAQRPRTAIDAVSGAFDADAIEVRGASPGTLSYEDPRGS